uniref:Uncharacterized protein n=1 Tax=Compsopogon caeruleus TaxID=31354 RepID=A0A7S1TCX6_9RHOD|mmetsp:Transcript_17464/g.36257  ORF Transcript_17464/g.36257 Transcript_17464/m.36257 type:complete len:110 (+) Transcript_17464:275-604(+)
MNKGQVEGSYGHERWTTRLNIVRWFAGVRWYWISSMWARACGLELHFSFSFFLFWGGERSRVLPEKILQVSRARGGDITTESYSRVYLILLTNDIDRNTKDRVDGYGFR